MQPPTYLPTYVATQHAEQKQNNISQPTKAKQSMAERSGPQTGGLGGRLESIYYLPRGGKVVIGASHA